MTFRHIPLLIAGAAGAILLAGPAAAQIGRGDAPVEITSKKGEYLQNEGRGVYTCLLYTSRCV